jgi:hypothetical protein
MREALFAALRGLKKQRFEELFEALLSAEREQRFDPGVVVIDGPSDEDVADGGSDALVRVSRAPHEQVDDALIVGYPTGEDPVETRYSCKTKNDPDDGRTAWQATIRKAVDPDDAWSRHTNPKVDAEAAQRYAEKHGSKDAEQLWDTLARGGHYVIVLGWRPGNLEPFRREIVDRLNFRLSIHHPDQDRDLSNHVKFIDAGYLARAIERLEPKLNSATRALLGMSEKWDDWARWSERYSDERRRMTFVEDPQRESCLRELRRFLADPRPDDRTVHLWGPPGVGKTRLVHELLAELDGVESRVRHAIASPELVTWLNSSEGSIASDGIYVVDEVEAANLRTTLLKPFNRASRDQPNARLIAIGPLEREHEGYPPPLTLEPLGDEQARALLRDEMGDDARLERVLELCEGYPLFILWLGKALSQNPSLLADPGAKLTGDRAQWDTCVGVLDSPRADEGEARLRAKALLLALLVPEGRWQRLDDAEQDKLARALEAEWHVLMEQGDEVADRGLLRRLPDGRCYISPRNLERMVLNHFFGGSEPPLDPQAVRQRVPKRADNLLRRAELVGASDSCKRNLAVALLEAVHDCDDRGAWITWMRGLRLASRVAPEPAARLIHAAIGRLGPPAAEDDFYLRELSSSLAHLSHRAISAAAFEHVEASVYALARLHVHPRPDTAKRLWMQLFDPAAHMTRQPHARRWELLVRRLESDHPSQRELAIAALERGLDPRLGALGWAPGIDDVDGAWEHERLSAAEHHQRLQQYWGALLDAADDPSDEVAHAARRAIAERLRQGLRAGLDAAMIHELAVRQSSWTADERAGLAHQAAQARRHDNELLEAREHGVGEAFAELLDRVAPNDWTARLRARLGRRDPDPWPSAVDDDASAELAQRDEDVGLAAELLADPERFTESADWLLSSQAVRANEFAIELGRLDQSQRMYSRLREHLTEPYGREFAAHYLLGWRLSIGLERFDAWLEEARAREQPGFLVWVLIHAAPASESRTKLLLELLRDHEIPADALWGLGNLYCWPSDTTRDTLDALIECLAERDDATSTREGVSLVNTRVKRFGVAAPDVTLDAIHELLDRATATPLPALVELHWSQIVVELAKSGDLAPLRSAFARTVRKDVIDHPAHLVTALRALEGSGIADSLWPLVAERLEAETGALKLALALRKTRLLEALSPDLVLDWVGGDSERAQAITLLLRPDSELLGPIVHALISRFGADSRVARVLATTMSTPIQPMADRLEFRLAQARRARGWAAEGSDEVRRWAQALAEQLERGAAQDHADKLLRHG